MLAVKLQPRLARHMAGLGDRHLQLHLLHHTLCLEVAARQADGAALLQCLRSLQPHSSRLTGGQRASILAAVASQHSAVVHEAAAVLLLDSIAADGSLEAVMQAPPMLQLLSLPAKVQLTVVLRCRQLLEAMLADFHLPARTQCCQASS